MRGRIPMLAGILAAGMSCASAEGDAAAWFEQALRQDDAGETTLAFAQFRRAAEAGLPQAEFNVAAMLDSGRGVERDIGQAATWYARAAARGNARAAYNLGQLYQSGQGVPQNRDVARAWFAASGLKAAGLRIAALTTSVSGDADLSAPTPVVPSQGATVRRQPDGIELVWTAAPQPEKVTFFVELRHEGAEGSREIFSTFAATTSVVAAVPASEGDYIWRVTTVSRTARRYVASPWRVFTVAPD